MRAKYKIKLGYGFRGNAFGMDNFTKIKELTSVTETHSRKARIYAEEKAEKAKLMAFAQVKDD